MAVKFHFRIEGLRELDRALAELPRSVAKPVLIRGMKKTLEPTKNLAVMFAPQETGRYAKTILITGDLKDSQKKDGELKSGVTVYVGSSSPLAHLFEFGWHPGGGATFTKRPHLRAAWDSTKEEVRKRFARFLWAEILKATKKLASKAVTGGLSKSAMRHFRGA